MKRPWVSLVADPPHGFVYRADLSPRELRSGVFALFAGSVREASSRLEALFGKISGVVVTRENLFSWATIAPRIHHLGVPPGQEPHLPVLLGCCLELLEAAQEQAEENRRLSLEFSRSVEDRRRLVADFANARESLLEEIRDRRAAETALRTSEERYRLVVENAGEIIFVAQDGLIKFPNPALALLTGYTAEEITGGPFVNFIHPEDRETVAERYRKRLRGEDVPSRYTFRVVTKNGDTLWMEIGTVRIAWEGRPATLNFLRDITPQKTLEAQLLHAQKMEAIGTLAGGIAHDFNNLLQAISGFAALAIRELPEENASRPHVRNIERAAERASGLVKRLLAFSRREAPETKIIDLNREIAHTVVLLERIIPKMVRIETRPAKDLRPIPGDPAQIEQVLMNLGANARDAMPDGGRLTIETANVVVPPAFRPQEVTSPGPYVRIRVSDTGTGMDPLTLSRIFDPFFTTKDVGAGTGLGLSTVYGIVRRHGGWIRCDSRPGQGTTFEIHLPAADAPSPAAETPKAPPPAGPAGGKEAILLVDDDPMVRNVARIVLEERGYTVVCAGSGEEALDLFRPDIDRFAIVILDLGMPGMGGRKCLEAMRRIKNDVRTLVVSGYGDEQQARGILEAGAGGFLAKPYRTADFARTVRSILDAPLPE